MKFFFFIKKYPLVFSIVVLLLLVVAFFGTDIKPTKALGWFGGQVIHSDVCSDQLLLVIVLGPPSSAAYLITPVFNQLSNNSATIEGAWALGTSLPSPGLTCTRTVGVVTTPVTFMGIPIIPIATIEMVGSSLPSI